MDENLFFFAIKLPNVATKGKNKIALCATTSFQCKIVNLYPIVVLIPYFNRLFSKFVNCLNNFGIFCQNLTIFACDFSVIYSGGGSPHAPGFCPPHAKKLSCPFVSNTHIHGLHLAGILTGFSKFIAGELQNLTLAMPPPPHSDT